MILIKIYPCNRTLKICDTPDYLDIPLSHIEKDITPNSVQVVRSDNFLKNKNSYISPFDEFDSDDFIAFNSKREMVNITMQKNSNDKYTYLPNNSIEFTPSTFIADILIKKKLKYSSGNTYDLKICVSEKDDKLTWSKQLISIFGDAYKKGICPTSIRVNNGANYPISLISSSYEDNDFLFVETIDGKNLSNSLSLDAETMLKSHTNIWITVPTPKYADDTNLSIRKNVVMTPPINQHVLYNKVSAQIPDVSLFNKNEINYMETIEDTYTGYKFDRRYEKLGVLIAHKENFGYIVFSYSDFLNNLSSNVEAIYDILMYIYLQSYLNISTNEVFITNSIIDNYCSVTNSFKKHHPILNIDELLLNNNNVIDNYEIISVSTSNPDVLFSNIDSLGNLNFIKIGGTSDPIQKSDESSLYTTRGTIVIYKSDNVSILETPVTVDTSIDDTNTCYVTLNSLFSSTYKIRVLESKTFKINDNTITYCLVVLPIDKNGESSVILLPQNDYVEDAGYCVAIVKVIYTSEDTAFDVRSLAGGLSYSATDDYDLLDIGSYEGKPYRAGVSGIIKLPKKLSSYNTIIENAVKKHKCATDYFYIVYE